MITLVTGASGFIGRHLCARLAAEGHEIRAVVRESARAPFRTHPVIVDDLCSFQWSTALRDVDVVYHLAAKVHEMSNAGDFASYHSINRDATVRLAEASMGAGIKQFVFMSTAKVAGERTPNRPATEADTPQPSGPYAVTKWEAEQALTGIAPTSQLVVTIFRPPLVYGEGVRANFLSLMRAIDRRWPLPIAAVRSRRSLVYVENLVDAMVVCSRAVTRIAGTFFVTDGVDVSVSDLARRLGEALDRRPLLLPIPPPLLIAMATAAGRRGVAERLTETFCVDSTKLRQVSHWQPPYSLDEGLRNTAEWYRAAHR